MRAVIQRVLNAKVEVDFKITGEIGQGLLILLGIEENDEQEDLDWLCKKIGQMRLFSDQEGKMNRSIQDIQGEILLVSQFTLYASTAKGNRPSFIKAAKPEKANAYYEACKISLNTYVSKPLQSGLFGADMKVSLLNDGPVTIIIDSKNKE
jgi:D-tyrosyl-tRNA(Tyr) deacylase